MPSNTISIAVVANAKPAVTSFAETSTAAEDMGRSVDRAGATFSSAVDKMSADTKGIASDMDRASHSVGELGDKMGDGASKSSQFAGGIGDIGGALSQIPGPLGALGSGMEAIGPTLMGLVGAFDLMELAANASSLAWLRNAASATASRVALIAGAVATGVMTAAQWLLNVALASNPIGLIILGIAALIAIFVIAWNKSETFRNILIATWEGIKGAAVAVFGFVRDFIGGVFDDIGAVWKDLLALPQKMKEIGTAIVQGIADGIQGGLHWVKEKIGYLGNLLPSWLAKILQIRSPSRRFMKLGQESIRGYAIGFNSMTAKDIVSPLASRLSSTAISVPSAQTTLSATGTASTTAAVAATYNINVPEGVTNPYEYGRRIADGLTAFKRLGGVIPQ
jgi:phage-related protein